VHGPTSQLRRYSRGQRAGVHGRPRTAVDTSELPPEQKAAGSNPAGGTIWPAQIRARARYAQLGHPRGSETDWSHPVLPPQVRRQRDHLAHLADQLTFGQVAEIESNGVPTRRIERRREAWKAAGGRRRLPRRLHRPRAIPAAISAERLPRPRRRTQRDLVVLSDFLVADSRVVREPSYRPCGALPVRLRDGAGLAGPLVIPGVTSFLDNYKG
jgi:hypothetical protein